MPGKDGEAANMSEKPLLRELKYFIQHQDELMEQHRGKVVVIQEDRVIGIYNSELEALRDTSRHHPCGTFMVQRCEPGPECYTATFYGSRAVFQEA